MSQLNRQYLEGVYKRVRIWLSTRPRVQEWRRNRYETFRRAVRLVSSDVIVDIGAGRGGALEHFNQTNQIIALDRHEGDRAYVERFSNVTFKLGDALDMPFADRELDIAFCNSVIEHIPRRDRERFASEIRRVADRYFVQTPNRYFPIEPHYMVPLAQFLPTRVRRVLDRRLMRNDEIELLTAAELRRLFPDAVILRERMFGLTKSLMAVRPS